MRIAFTLPVYRYGRAYHRKKPTVARWISAGEGGPHSNLGSFVQIYLRPTTITVKLPGIIVGRGRGLSAVGAGLGPNSAVTR